MIAVGEAKIKYEKLDQIYKPIIENKKLISTNINMILDLKEIFKKIFRETTFNEERLLTPESRKTLLLEMSSDIINIIGHYRNYNYKHLNKYTTFYIVYSKKECEFITKKLPDYKESFYKKYYRDPQIKKLIDKSIKIIELIINAIPHTYFIDSSEYDEAIWFNYLIKKFNPNDMTVLLTNDPIILQSLNKNIIVINLKGKNSTIIDEENLYESLVKNLKIKPIFSKKLYPLMLSISGVEQYDIKGVKGYRYRKSINTINKMLKNNHILDEKYLDMTILEQSLKHYFSLEEIDIIKKNYQIVFLDYFNTLIDDFEMDFIYQSSLQKNYLTSFSLQDINKLFSDYPIVYEMLFKGEKMF